MIEKIKQDISMIKASGEYKSNDDEKIIDILENLVETVENLENVVCNLKREKSINTDDFI